ncbi:MAG: large conductance mechanosensitive channel protein MscL [Acidimicrobiia bacterium]|nr:large conductance mechanosensitive channel protein MscL [Acidimicrobiia bacterium]NNF10948.1 large conductance mechanosensitive channel protein MscL [Acidimicrobiia bacterium]NNL69374.1 large conductance mechanosensitive channel protein MscL [Acidimicrobiia bacterium]
MLNEFREFAIKGNVVDMAVGIIIGAAFTSVVNSVVDDVLTPVVGSFAGDLDFADRFWVIESGNPAGPYASVDAAEEAGAVVVAYGNLINQVISFLIVAVALFVLIRWINRLRRTDTEAAPTTRSCPFCKSHIDQDASRCPQCTSQLEAV